jgi:hypothetical protein
MAEDQVIVQPHRAVASQAAPLVIEAGVELTVPPIEPAGPHLLGKLMKPGDLLIDRR